jgi:hypothetical protein
MKTRLTLAEIVVMARDLLVLGGIVAVSFILYRCMS